MGEIRSDSNRWSRRDRLKIWLNQRGGFIFRVQRLHLSLFRDLSFWSQSLTKATLWCWAFLKTEGWEKVKLRSQSRPRHVNLFFFLFFFTFAMRFESIMAEGLFDCFQVGICCPCHKHLAVTLITIANAEVHFKQQRKKQTLDDTLIKAPPTWLKNKRQLIEDDQLESLVSQPCRNKKNKTQTRGTSPNEVTFFPLAFASGAESQSSTLPGWSSNEKVWENKSSSYLSYKL